ncbi:MAG: alcohol dehydrogenase catalytic domain-containing protein [Kofleriaceae bacterium]
MIGDDDVAIELEGTNGAAAIGRVIDAGTRAKHLVGKRVLASAIDPCGECDVCRRGGAAVCPSARRRTAPLASPVIAAARWLVTLGEPGGVDLPSPAGAVVAGDLALAYTLYARTGVGPRDPVVVVGDSPIARHLAAVLRAKGITPATAGTPDEIRAGFAEQGLGQKPWRVIATDADATAPAAALCGPRSTLTVLAPIPALPGDLAAREVTVIAVAGAHPDLLTEIVASVMKGELPI